MQKRLEKGPRNCRKLAENLKKNFFFSRSAHGKTEKKEVFFLFRVGFPFKIAKTVGAKQKKQKLFRQRQKVFPALFLQCLRSFSAVFLQCLRTFFSVFLQFFFSFSAVSPNFFCSFSAVFLQFFCSVSPGSWISSREVACDRSYSESVFQNLSFRMYTRDSDGVSPKVLKPPPATFPSASRTRRTAPRT